ncbi:MAG: hypothetical protein KDE58_20010, partial [Caldilineaceae bacterium]|nr:hypothetical protein [Caldilineaceae bacterium]
MNHFHVKTLVGTALYGLPMVRIQPPTADALQSAAHRAAVPLATVQTARVDQAAATVLERSTYVIDTSTLQRIDAVEGSYYTFSGQRPYAEANQPVQPQLQMLVNAINADGALLTPRGVVFRGAQYTVQSEVTPLVEAAGILGERLAPVAGTARAVLSGTLPVPVHLGMIGQGSGTGNLLAGSHPARLNVLVGHYDSSRQAQLLFSTVIVDKYYSADPDTTAPQITAVVTSESNGERTFTVTATDASAMTVVVAYDDPGASAWRAIELVAANGRWTGTIPGTANYLVQVVDAAGNVATHAPTVERTPAQTVFLPFVAR